MNRLEIILTYKFSELDNENQFGLTFVNNECHEVYIRWIFFYLGAKLHGKTYPIYQFSLNKVLKKYKNCNDAKRQAQFIINAINRKLQK